MTGLLAAAALWSSGTWIFQNCLRFETEEAWMASGLCFFAQTCGTVVLLGHLNALYPAPVICVEILIFLAQTGALLMWKMGSHHSGISSFRRKPESSRLDPGLRIAGVTNVEKFPGRILVSWPLAAATAAFALVLALRFLVAYALPPAGRDALNYHLSIPFQWIRHGNLSLVAFPRWERYYPRNAELLCAWLAELSGGRIEVAKAFQGLALPLLGLAAASLAKSLAGRQWVWPCALAAMAMPFAVAQAGMAYVDLLHAAFWLAAAAFILRFERTCRVSNLWLFALALGLAAGTKGTAYFEAALLIPLAWICLSNRELGRLAARADAPDRLRPKGIVGPARA